MCKFPENALNVKIVQQIAELRTIQQRHMWIISWIFFRTGKIKQLVSLEI